MKKWTKFILGFLLIIFLSAILKASLNWERDGDLKFGVVAENNIEVVSISPERTMVNILNVDSKTPLWLPGGLGWYQTDRIKKILDYEDKRDQMDEIFFYNLGFVADKILYLKEVDDWKKDSVFITNFGFANWLKWRNLSSNSIVKTENIKSDLEKEMLLLDEIMGRDFADNKIINEDLRLSIVNTTPETGLANFLARNLSWAGFSVVSTENSIKKIDGCLVIFGPKSVESWGGKVINKLFKCQNEINNDLNENEIELYFGENYAQMIKYSTYMQSM